MVLTNCLPSLAYFYSYLYNIYIALAGINDGRALKELKEDPEKYLPFTLEIDHMKNGQAIAKAASKHYFGDHPTYENQLTQFEQVRTC